MDYFKSLSSAVLAKTSGAFPAFSIGEKVDAFEGQTIWSLHDGVRRSDGQRVSIFIFDAHRPSHDARHLPLAKNAARRLRTVRHPDVLRFLDSHETASAVYIASEHVVPVSRMLSASAADVAHTEWIGWGLSRIANAASFINVEAASLHGNIRLESIFLADSGEWRLGGFEVLQATADPDGAYFCLATLLPDASHTFPPEIRSSSPSEARGQPPHVVDSYGLGLLALEAYNGPQPPMHGVPAQGKVPLGLFKALKRMLTPAARSRLSTAQFLQDGDAPGGYFASNRLVQVAAGIDNFLLATEGERASLLHTLDTTVTSLPGPFVTWKVIPVLLRAMEAPPTVQGLGPSATMAAPRLIPLCLRMSKNMEDEDWKRLLLPAVVKAYASPDRAMRMALLLQLPDYLDRLNQKIVVEKIWSPLSIGLGDSNPQLREATLRAILPLAPKFSERILNNDLLRALAKTQIDPESSIRTNTAVLLGKLVPYFNTNTKKQVLVPAFVRSLKDSFVHARMAGLLALVATGDEFEVEDLAKQALPAVIPCLLDRDKRVRDEAARASTAFFRRIQQAAEQMPTTPEEQFEPVPEPLDAAADTDTGHAVSTPSSESMMASLSSPVARQSFSSASAVTPSQNAVTNAAPSQAASIPSRLSAEKTLPRHAATVEVKPTRPPPRSSARLNTLRAHSAPKVAATRKALNLGSVKPKPSLAEEILRESSAHPVSTAPLARPSTTFDAPVADADDWGDSWDEPSDSATSLLAEGSTLAQRGRASSSLGNDDTASFFHDSLDASARRARKTSTRDTPQPATESSVADGISLSSLNSPSVVSAFVPSASPEVTLPPPASTFTSTSSAESTLECAPTQTTAAFTATAALLPTPATSSAVDPPGTGSVRSDATEDDWDEMDDDGDGKGFAPLAPVVASPSQNVSSKGQAAIRESSSMSPSPLAQSVDADRVPGHSSAPKPVPAPTPAPASAPAPAPPPAPKTDHASPLKDEIDSPEQSISSQSVTVFEQPAPSERRPSPPVSRTPLPVSPPPADALASPAPVSVRTPQTLKTTVLAPTSPASPPQPPDLGLNSRKNSTAHSLSPSTTDAPNWSRSESKSPLQLTLPSVQTALAQTHLASPVLRATSPALSVVSPIAHMGNSPAVPTAPATVFPFPIQSLSASSPISRAVGSPLIRESSDLDESSLRPVSPAGSGAGSVAGSFAGSGTGTFAPSTRPGSPASTIASNEPPGANEDKRARLMRQRQERKDRLAKLRAGSHVR